MSCHRKWKSRFCLYRFLEFIVNPGSTVMKSWKLNCKVCINYLMSKTGVNQPISKFLDSYPSRSISTTSVEVLFAIKRGNSVKATTIK
jgi:hypothetical protein